MNLIRKQNQFQYTKYSLCYLYFIKATLESLTDDSDNDISFEDLAKPSRLRKNLSYLVNIYFKVLNLLINDELQRLMKDRYTAQTMKIRLKDEVNTLLKFYMYSIFNY